MKSSVEEVKEILKNYHFLEMQVKNGMLDEEMVSKVRFVENCIKGLNEDDFKLMVGLYFEKVGTAALMHSLHIAIATIYTRRNAVVKRIAFLFERKFIKN